MYLKFYRPKVKMSRMDIFLTISGRGGGAEGEKRSPLSRFAKGGLSYLRTAYRSGRLALALPAQTGQPLFFGPVRE